MARRHDWPERLNAYLAEAALQTFAWGERDCALFAAGAVQAMTGIDLCARFRGKYAGEIGAAKLMRRFCAGGLLEALEKVLAKYQSVPPLCAQRGDVVYLEYDQVGPTVAIMDLRGVVVTVHKQGLAYLPAASALRAWRVD